MKTTNKVTKIKAVYKKEMLDLLRDKKTLIMMLIVPLVLYPLIMMSSVLIGASIADSIQSDEYHIAVTDDKANRTINGYDGDVFREILADTEDNLKYHLVIEDIPPKECAEALSGENIDAYIEVSADTDDVRNVITIHYLSSKTSSAAAADMIEDKLELYKKHTSRQLLDLMGADNPDFLLEPVNVSFDDMSANEERVGKMLGTILPMLMVTSILLGAFYSAVDTTAGEKERGTLETLLTLPVGNGELIVGKFLAVSTVAVASAILNLISMLFMSLYFYAIMQSSDAQALSINLTDFIPALIIVLLCVAAFALFISAVTMCVTIFAKSFKEANNYATPLMLVVMFATFVTFMPNVEFTAMMAAVPIVNICMLISNILVFKYSFSLIMIVFLSSITYAALAIILLIRLYDSEDMLFGESGVNIHLFSGRKEIKSGGVPTLSDAVIVLSVMLLLFLYAGPVVQLKFRIWGILMTQVLIILMPLAAAWYTKSDFKKTFSIKAPKPVWIIGAVLSEIGCYVIVILVAGLLSKVFPQDTKAVNDAMQYMLDDTGFVIALFVTAAAPAICEEMLFRGYFLAASVKRLNPAAAILIGAAVFGIYHLSFVKFFTTGILGCLFCWIVYRTGSIFLTMLMHFINNMFAVFAMFYPEKMEKFVPVLVKENISGYDAAVLLIFGMACLAMGLAVLVKTSRTCPTVIRTD